ncbi:hypothetical protein UT300003_00810 [Clostridium sardiniense]
MNRIKNMIGIIIIIIISGMIIGCSEMEQLIDKSKENIVTEKYLKQYEIDKGNFKYISYQEEEYNITEDKLDIDKIGDPIGKVSKNITIDENYRILNKKELREIDIFSKNKEEKRFNISIGWIHKIKGIDQNEKIAVMINSKYYIAERKI